MKLSHDEKMLLLLACQEELEYHVNSRIVPIVTGKPDGGADKIKKIMLEAQAAMIDNYSKWMSIIKACVESKTDDVPIDPKTLVIICKDHIQSVEKYIVVKLQIDGSVSEARVFGPVATIMMKGKDMYMQQFVDLISRIEKQK